MQGRDRKFRRNCWRHKWKAGKMNLRTREVMGKSRLKQFLSKRRRRFIDSHLLTNRPPIIYESHWRMGHAMKRIILSHHQGRLVIHRSSISFAKSPVSVAYHPDPLVRWTSHVSLEHCTAYAPIPACLQRFHNRSSPT